MANWIVIIISSGLGILATIRALVQSKYNKRYARNENDVGKLIFFSLILAAICILPFVVITGQWDYRSILWGLLAGVFNGIYQYCFSFTLKKGPMGLSILINQLSMIFPIIFSVLCYKEEFNLFRIFATLLIVASFFLNAKKDKTTKTSVKWFVLAIMTMAFNASICIIYKVFTEIQIYDGANYGFIMFTYIGALSISIIMFIYWKIRAYHKYKVALKNIAPGEIVRNPMNGYRIFKKPNKHQVFAIIFIALYMVIYDVFDVLCVTYSPGPFYFPLVHGITLILSIFAGKIFYKEKHNIFQYTAIAFVLIAIILLTLGGNN